MCRLNAIEYKLLQILSVNEISGSGFLSMVRYFSVVGVNEDVTEPYLFVIESILHVNEFCRRRENHFF